MRRGIEILRVDAILASVHVCSWCVGGRVCVYRHVVGVMCGRCHVLYYNHLHSFFFSFGAP